MPKVTIIQPTKPDDSGKIRAAAYCRVSTNTADQHHSYTVQMEYYTRLFENSTTELLVGIYADEGISGTGSENRNDFQRMLRDCRKGKIDRIYTKSISRFARNTKDCLLYIRELRTLGVSVFFEKENIDTGRITDEMMLTIMGGLAQEESTSLAQNMRWGVRKRMQNGTYKIGIPPYGYRMADGELVIEESEAAVVRQIYAWFLEGNGVMRITQMLNAAGYPTSNGLEKWGKAHVRYILSNERYAGDTVLQKTFITVDERGTRAAAATIVAAKDAAVMESKKVYLHRQARFLRSVLQPSLPFPRQDLHRCPPRHRDQTRNAYPEL